MSRIPIVFAANDEYAPYLGVAISSLIHHSFPQNEYLIYILERCISHKHKKQLKMLQTPNVRIEFCDVSDKLDGVRLFKVNHISEESTYRLLIPKIFSEFDKILYLDSDIIILRDVAELYTEDISDYLIGCTRAWLLIDLANYIRNTLKLAVNDYFNPGVCLMNVPRLIGEKIAEKGLSMLSKTRYLTQDQDVLNLLCQGNVKYLDSRWNVEWGYATGLIGDAVFDESRKNMPDTMRNPYIVHYASAYKPWTHPELPMAEYFWLEARQTEFYYEILKKNSAVLREEANVFRRFIFPWHLVKLNSKIIIYGGGEVGRAFCSQLAMTQYCHVLAVCDKFPDNVVDVNVPVVSIDELSTWSADAYDAIVIAIKNKDISSDVRAELLKYGIDEGKIAWDNPLKKDVIEVDKEGHICQ